MNKLQITVGLSLFDSDGEWLDYFKLNTDNIPTEQGEVTASQEDISKLIQFIVEWYEGLRKVEIE